MDAILIGNAGTTGPALSCQAHIKHICRNCYFHINNAARLKPSLSKDDTPKPVHVLIFSQCPSLLSSNLSAVYNLFRRALPGSSAVSHNSHTLPTPLASSPLEDPFLSPPPDLQSLKWPKPQLPR